MIRVPWNSRSVIKSLITSSSVLLLLFVGYHNDYSMVSGRTRRSSSTHRKKQQQSNQNHTIVTDHHNCTMGHTFQVYSPLAFKAAQTHYLSSNFSMKFSPLNVSCNDMTWMKGFSHGCCSSKRPPVTERKVLQLLELWRNQTILFVGDSMTGQTIDALMIGIKTNNIGVNCTSKSFVHEDPGKAYLCFLPSHNISLRYLWNYRLEIRPKTTAKGTIDLNNYFAEQIRILPYSTFEEEINAADVSYTNFGLHHHKDPEWLMDVFYEYIKNVLEADLKRNAYKNHFYRLSYPQHFKSSGETSSYAGALTNCSSFGTIASRQELVDTPAWAWVEPYDKEQDFRKALFSVDDYFNGPGEVSKRELYNMLRPHSAPFSTRMKMLSDLTVIQQKLCQQWLC